MSRQQPDYSYGGNSNLVLQADRSGLGRRRDEPSGEVSSLGGRIDARTMGDRAAVPKGASKSDSKDPKDQGKKTKKDKDQEYHARTAETRHAHALLLGCVHSLLGDAPDDVLRDAASETLRILTNPEKKAYDAKADLEALLGPVPTDAFATLTALAKRLDDYSSGLQDGDVDLGDDDDDRAPAPDADYGVAVLFDDSDSDNGDVRGSDDEDDNDARSDASNGAIQGPGVTPDSDSGSGAESDSDLDSRIVIGRQPQTTTPLTQKDALSEIHPRDIDAYWLQRHVAEAYPDARTALHKSSAAYAILASESNARDAENQLMELFDFAHFALVKLLTRNRTVIVACLDLVNAAGDPVARDIVIKRVYSMGLLSLLTDLGLPFPGGASVPLAKILDSKFDSASLDKRLDLTLDKVKLDADMDPDTESSRDTGRRTVKPKTISTNMDMDTDMDEVSRLRTTPLAPAPKNVLDLAALSFTSGGHLMSNKRVKLPEGSFKRTKKGWEEVHVPAPKSKPMEKGEALIPITDLPAWAQPAFKTASSLNRIQSRTYPTAFGSDEPLLLCAPTGAGKTNVAMLTVLREIGKYRSESGAIDLDNFKLIYIAPMKALVQEMVGNFSSRLEYLGIQVAELTGDRQLTKQQIKDTQIIVTTPEKYDIITRKATDRSYTNLVRLIIIDEIHLLHDDRGPVLESIVSRTIRHMEATQEPVRLVGLSATLPNYADVATFLRVNPATGLFFFDNSFRPCPLKQQYIGVHEKKAFKRFQMMNEITYEKVLEQAGQSQVLVFAHSRKDTAKTAKALRDMFLANETISQILKQDAASREILKTEAETAKNADLADLLPYGFAIHHAGMTRADRTLVEDLFADGHIQVLCSTATLAWGVNLVRCLYPITRQSINQPAKTNKIPKY